MATNILASQPPNGPRLQHRPFVPIKNTRLFRIKFCHEGLRLSMYLVGGKHLQRICHSRKRQHCQICMWGMDITLIDYISNYSQFTSEGVGFIKSLFFPKFKAVLWWWDVCKLSSGAGTCASFPQVVGHLLSFL